MNEILDCQSVCQAFESNSSRFELLKDVDLNVKRGEIVSISGKSGSGKSTLLHILSSLLKPISGIVRIDGEDIYSLDRKKTAELRNKKIGFVFQSFNLIAELNVFENIVLPIEINGKDKKRYTSEILDMAERLGVSGILKSKTSQISGGEKARVALLRSIALHPDIVFLDEPTGALDTATSKAVEDLILELSGNLSTSFVYVTHDSDFAARAHSRYVIKDTRLIRL